MKWLCRSMALGLLVAGTAGHAQIYEWRDATGARHFTNRMDTVPAEQQPATRVLVAESRKLAPEAEPPAAAPPVEPRRQAEVIYDYSSLRDAYAAGLRDGLALAGGGAGEAGEVMDRVAIHGPLAVASARVQEPFFYPSYHPFVTTSFDRGRSRHLTLRMLLQDQFQLDREGPFAFQRINRIGLGPALQPILPRALPHGDPRRGRVVYR